MRHERFIRHHIVYDNIDEHQHVEHQYGDNIGMISVTYHMPLIFRRRHFAVIARHAAAISTYARRRHIMLFYFDATSLMPRCHLSAFSLIFFFVYALIRYSAAILLFCCAADYAACLFDADTMMRMPRAIMRAFVIYDCRRNMLPARCPLVIERRRCRLFDTIFSMPRRAKIAVRSASNMARRADAAR